MNSKKNLLLFLLLFPLLLAAGTDVPALKGRVNDYANLLNASQNAEIESMLAETENATSAQVVLLTISTLNGSTIEEFAMAAAEKWKLGQKKFDNGILLVVALKERKIRLEVGYGLEGIIPDIKAGYIIRRIMVPEFKRDHYYQGIQKGLALLTSIIRQETDISREELEKFRKDRKKSGKSNFPIGLIIFIIFIVLGNIGGPKGRGRRSSLPFIFFGGGSGGSSGGFGGGGFSGGGGSFGGGGASGGW